MRSTSSSTEKDLKPITNETAASRFARTKLRGGKCSQAARSKYSFCLTWRPESCWFAHTRPHRATDESARVSKGAASREVTANRFVLCRIAVRLSSDESTCPSCHVDQAVANCCTFSTCVAAPQGRSPIHRYCDIFISQTRSTPPGLFAS
jgi:hypothetical protein